MADSTLNSSPLEEVIQDGARERGRHIANELLNDAPGAPGNLRVLLELLPDDRLRETVRAARMMQFEATRILHERGVE